jgi:hypothetical protein
MQRGREKKCVRWRRKNSFFTTYQSIIRSCLKILKKVEHVSAQKEMVSGGSRERIDFLLTIYQLKSFYSSSSIKKKKRRKKILKGKT